MSPPPDTGLDAPHSLDQRTVTANVDTEKVGNYALSTSKQGGFVVDYVGRSDDDIRGRLLKWVGKQYKRFKFGYQSNVRAAFDKECTMYHDFGGSGRLDNDIHPDRPPGETWPCPVAGCHELDT